LSIFRSLILLALALVFGSTRSWALDPTRSISQFQHKSWTTAEGMPADIWSITQTPDGYLLLGSVNGLYRFDGIKVEQLVPNQLPSPSVHTIAATPDGGLWIGFERPVGVVSFLKNGHVTNYPIVAPGSTKAARIIIGPDATPWLCTPDNILRFDGNAWKVIGSDWGSSLGQAGGGVWEFGVAPDGTVWSKNESHLYYLAPGSERFVLAQGYPGGPEAFTTTADGRYATADAVTQRLYLLPPMKGRTPADLPPPEEAASMPYAVFSPILVDRDKTLWFTSIDGGGLGRSRRINGGAAQFDLFTKNEGLTSNLVHVVFEDREGTIWVGTSTGLDRISPANVVTDPRVPVGYRDRLVKATSRGLFAYTGWSNTNTRLTKGTGALYQITADGIPRIVLHDFGRLRNMFVNNKRGHVWITTDKGVQPFEANNETGSPIELPPGIQINQVYSGAEDDRGAVWISVFHQGVFRRNEKGWKKIPVRPRTAATAVLISGLNNDMWIRYSGGSLFRVVNDHVQDFTDQARGIGDITLIAPGPHSLIIGGETGISIFDGKRFFKLRASDIPVLSVITGVTTSKDGSIWIFAQAGVIRINPATFEAAVRAEDPKQFRYELFDSYDGLPGAPYGAVYGSTIAEAPDGRVWFTTGNGLAWIDPYNLHHNLLPPPLSIKRLTANDDVYAPPSSIMLPAGTSKAEIEYTALSLTVPERLHFRYKLDGVDDGWVEAGNRRQAFYTGLGPGNYKFHVIASNNDGTWNNKGTVAAFSIPPTFLQSRWLYLICILAVLLLLWVAYQVRLKQVSARLASHLEARMGERERIARDLHDTLLQGFHGLMLRFQSVADSIPKDQQARQMLEHVMVRADEVLAQGRDRVQDLRGAEVQDLAQALQEVAANAELGSAIKFEVNIEGTPQPIHPIAADELIQLSTEAILNSYRHANATHICVSLSYNKNRLRLCIRDNGMGIEEDVLTRGGRPGHFGLAGMRERAQKIKADFFLTSDKASGTKIEVSVPAAFAYPKPLAAGWHRLRSVLTVK
jgi:signal transduction histidine kinase/ligand-binding sensor domain-containing protein